MRDKEIKFKKKKIVIGILFSVIGTVITLIFILYPNTFIRSPSEKPIYMQIFGILALPFFAALLFSFSKLLSRKYALIIGNDYLIDHSKYEALGKIYLEEISEIQRFGKRSVRLIFKKPIIKRIELNFLKKYLLFMQNFSFKNSVLITSAFLDCTIDDPYAEMLKAFRNSKSKN